MCNCAGREAGQPGIEGAANVHLQQPALLQPASGAETDPGSNAAQPRTGAPRTRPPGEEWLPEAPLAESFEALEGSLRSLKCGSAERLAQPVKPALEAAPSPERMILATEATSNELRDGRQAKEQPGKAAPARISAEAMRQPGSSAEEGRSRAFDADYPRHPLRHSSPAAVGAGALPEERKLACLALSPAPAQRQELFCTHQSPFFLANGS